MKYLKSYKLFEASTLQEVKQTLEDILLSVSDEGFVTSIQEYPKIGMFEIKIETIDPIITNDINHLTNYMSEEGYKSFVGCSKATIISLVKPNDLSDKLEKYFLDTINSCVIKTSKDFPDDKFWVNKEGNVIFRQDSKSGYFWCKYDTFWSFFSTTNHLQTQEIQAFMKYLLGQHLKLECITPICSTFGESEHLGQHLKLEGLTPPKNLRMYWG